MNCLIICSVIDEVGDHAVLHRADGFDVAGYLAQHGLGFAAHGLDHLLAVGAAFVADGDHRRLVQDDALVTGENQGVGGAKVNGQVGGEYADGKLRTFKFPLRHGTRFGLPSPGCRSDGVRWGASFSCAIAAVPKMAIAAKAEIIPYPL